MAVKFADKFSLLEFSKTMTSKSSNKKVFSLVGNAKLRQLYIAMLQCRILDTYARGMVRGLPTVRGQEAPFAGASIDLRPGDTVFSTHSVIANYLLGSDLAVIFQELHKNKQKAVPRPDTQIVLATGAALANRRSKNSSITIAFLPWTGEQSDTTQETLRFANENKLPVLYVRNAARESALPSYGFPVIPVDANDAVAVYRVAYECMLRARQGGGPSMIECRPWIVKSDPLRNMENYLAAKGLFTESWKQQVTGAFEQKIKRAIVQKQRRKPAQKTPSLQDNTYLYFR
jgi:TPP-dependent pyruvate/acetoin dehydrogenase alpha subunit